MRKKLYILAALAIASVSCDSDMLEFNPTDSGSGEELMKDASTAITSINGIYRSMWTAGWSTTGNTHQSFGIAAYNLAQETMGDDLIMQSQGNGWFWYDHVYNVKNQYMSSAFRSYDVWYANYKWIANANSVIAAKETMGEVPPTCPTSWDRPTPSGRSPTSTLRHGSQEPLTIR